VKYINITSLVHASYLPLSLADMRQMVEELSKFQISERTVNNG